MASQANIIDAIVIAAKRIGAENSKTPLAVVEDLIVGKIKSEFTKGRILVSTTSNGATSTYQIPIGATAGDLVSYYVEALRQISNSPDPLNPSITSRNIRRLRASFRNSKIT